MTTVHLTKISSNKKTGPIPVSTSQESTCPSSCPLIGSGCYANVGPLALHWKKVSAGERGMDWQAFCNTIAKLPKRQLWRHNQAGDLPHDNGMINADEVSALVKANKGKSGFTYTHHDVSIPENKRAIRDANVKGFTVNLSANNVDHAVELKTENPTLPVVSIVPLDFWGDSVKREVDGETFVRCPAEYNKDVSCATCGACAVRRRDSVIAFTVHGTQKKKANIIASA